MRFLAALGFALCLASPLAAAEAGRLTVTGEGHVETVPDMATLSLGVSHEAKSADEAMARVSAALATVLERLRAAGVAERDLQTQGLDLSPVWGSYGSGPDRRLTGFRATNMLSVRLRDLDGVGDILDLVIGDGANTFRGLSLGLQEPAPLRDAARRAAVADAMRKAALYAEAAGLTLGPVLSISEGAAEPPRSVRMETALASGDGLPVAPGEVSISALVTMVFEIDE